MPRTRGTRRAAGVLALAVAALTTAACTITPGGQGNDLGATSLLVGADNGSPTFERNFNPFSPIKRIGANLVYEPLFVVNSLDGEETPFLATEYQIVDTSTIDFTIREGVTWSDGEEFGADDVVFTFELLKEFPATDTRGVWQQVESVEADGDVVRFTLTDENVTVARNIMQQVIVPEHIWAEVDDPVTYADEEPVGTGPYLLGEFGPNEYSMVKNEDYRDADSVAAEELVYPASNTQIDLVSNGYDWAYGYISDVEGTWVEADPEHHSYWFPPGGVITLFPNLTEGPLAEEGVREGISLALDRDAIAQDAVEGYNEAAVQTGLLLPNMEAWVSPDIPNQGLVTQDVDAAMAAFESAGYTMSGDQLVGPDGAPLELTITTANGYTDWLRAVQSVQSQLEAVGITVNLDQPQPAAYQQALANGEFQLAMGSYGGTGSIYDDFNNLLNSEFAVPVGESTQANFQRFSDPEVDALLAQLKVSTDEAEQQEIAAQLQQVMYERVPTIALYYGGLWGLYNDSKFTGWPSADDPYASPKMWDSTPLLVVTRLEPVAAEG